MILADRPLYYQSSEIAAYILNLQYTYTFIQIVFNKTWSQETERQSGSTGCLNRNLCLVLKFTERPKTPGMTSKKNIAFPKANKLFAGDFVLIWMKQTLIWFSLQKDGTRNGFSNIKETVAEKLQLQMSVLHHPISTFQSPRLVSQVHMMAGQNIKKKYPMCPIPIKMLKQYATPNSSLHNLKIYSSKGCRKTSQI